MHNSRTGHVALALLTFVSLASAANANVFSSTSYSTATTFTDATLTSPAITMGIAYDGSNYWSVGGGIKVGSQSNSTKMEAEYNSAGVVLNTYVPKEDFRSVFTDNSGHVYARTDGGNVIFQQTAPGVFSSSVTLANTNPSAPSGDKNDLTNSNLNLYQSSVIVDGSGDFVALGQSYLATKEGVDMWNSAGAFLGNVLLAGFGSPDTDENFAEQYRGIASDGNYWLTYDGNGVLSAWTHAGVRVGTTTLVGAPINTPGDGNVDSSFSMSYANNLLFLDTGPGGTWKGYNIQFGSISSVPEPSSLAVMMFFSFGLAGLIMRARRRRTEFMV